jgi:hypothetical protein
MASRARGFFVAVAGLGVALGCGARTDTLFDDGNGGSAGTLSFAGYPSGGQGQGGSFQPTAGITGFGGSPTVGGSFAFGGSFGFGGTVGFAGTFGFGGSPSAGTSGIAGSPSSGGVGATAGSISFGGTTSVGGSLPMAGGPAVAGAGGQSPIVELCERTAQSACNACLCGSCATQLDACFSGVGCALIFACAQETQCQLLQCYQASTCRGVIDEFGGPTGAAVQQVFALGTCAAEQSSGCNCN